VNLGNVFEYVATGGHPDPIPGWLQVVVWPVLVVVAVLARPNNG